MFILKDYQENAVKDLIEKTCELLQQPSRRQQVLLKAPTGAGKTVMMASYLARLVQQLRLRPNLPADISFIWIAPNTLHLQSYAALSGFYSELHELKTVQIEDLDAGAALPPNNLLFINWSSVDKIKNKFRQDNEQSFNLHSLIEQTSLDGTEIIVLIDEAHYSAFNGEQAKKVRELIDAKIEISITATPQHIPNYNVVIPRHKVIEAEMIKKGVKLNIDVDATEQQGEMVDVYLLRQAMKKRDEIAKVYHEKGIRINPLLLIQLPNENNSLNEEDKRIRTIMTSYLENEFGISTENNELAVWLSDSSDKQNLDGIEAPNAIPKVLIFKQAIAQGWDCPRAAVLLIFREIINPTFGVQTVGRILRMPQQKHYQNDLLDYGYVYTNIQSHIIRIIPDDADYFTKQYAKRKDELHFPMLTGAVMVNDRPTPGYLTNDFKRIFFEQVEKKINIDQLPEVDLYDQQENDEEIKKQIKYNRGQFASNFWEMNVENIEIVIPSDIVVDPYEQGAVMVEQEHREHFVKNQAELSTMLDRFCFNSITSLNKSKSWKLLRQTLIEFAEYYAGYFEHEARRWLLYPQNLEKLIELINQSLENYDVWQKEQGNKNRRKEEIKWEVPKERFYSEFYEEDDSSKYHALQPYFEYKSTSNPERKFKEFLEQHADEIEWWYKNGDKGREHFSVTYKDVNDREQLFYVDYVIQFKSGKIGLFDTKTKGSDIEAPNKHNALIEYFDEMKNKGANAKYIGGIIIPEETAGIIKFRFCRNRINDTHDFRGWDYFDPASINKN